MYRAPDERGVEGAAPRVGGIDDGVPLPIACQILAAYIDGEVAEPTGDLCRQLFVCGEGVGPESVNGCGHSSAAVELQRHIELPES